MALRLRLTAVLLLCSCGSPPPPKKTAPPPPPPAGPTTAARFTSAADAFYQEYMERSPTHAMWLGLHQYDGKLPDVTAQGIAGRVEWLRSSLATFEAFAPADLDAERVIEREVLLTSLHGQLFDLDVRRRPFSDPMYYPDFLELTPYITYDYAPLADRARGIIAMCGASQAFLTAAEANLPEAMPRTWVDTALLQVNGMIEFASEDVATAMTALEDADLAAQVSEGLLACSGALTGYKQFLVKHKAKATDAYAIGEAQFVQMLAEREGVTIPLERLERIGRDDLERNLGMLELAARKLHPRKPIAAILADVARDKPDAAKIFDEGTAQVAAMRQLVVDKDLVSIPTDDVAEVRPSPPFMRWNFAFLNSPGPFEQKQMPAYYYISPPDPKWPKKEQRDYIPSRYDLLFTTVHEVWPGHFLQGLHEKKNPSRILKTFCSYAMVEGWAHYAEQMMLEEGAGGADPRAQVGQLLNALLRDARYVSAIGLHTRGMKLEESIALFQKRGMQDKATARQQAVRGTFDPGYLNYTLGKLMILKLREDWKAKQGAAFTLKGFHDRFLSYGCAPVTTIRRAMLGEGAGDPL
jgi:uncharacterized protein (DUF885 family)